MKTILRSVDKISAPPRRSGRTTALGGVDQGAGPWWRGHTALAATVTAAFAIFAVSCGSTAPESEPAPSGEAAGSTGSAGSTGADLYQTNCASCHGADLRGTDQGPSHLSIVYEPNHHGDDAFRSAILNGARQHHWNFGDMAPIEGLDDGEIDDVIAYIRAEQERQGFEQ